MRKSAVAISVAGVVLAALIGWGAYTYGYVSAYSEMRRDADFRAWSERERQRQQGRK